MKKKIKKCRKCQGIHNDQKFHDRVCPEGKGYTPNNW